MRRAANWVAVATCLGVLGSAPALARDAAPGFMFLGAQMDAPRGFVEMCASSPNPLCNNVGGMPVAPLRFASAQLPTGAVGPDPMAIVIPARRSFAMSYRAAPTRPSWSSDMRVADPTFRNDGSAIATGSNISIIDGSIDQTLVLADRHEIATNRLAVGDPTFASLTTLKPLNLPEFSPEGAIPTPIDIAPQVIQFTLPWEWPGYRREETAMTSGAIMLHEQPVESMMQPAVLSRLLSPSSLPQGVDAMKLLKAVNRQVNGHVQQRTDMQIFGQAEVWQRSGMGKMARGDCEDLAIEKRLRLMAGGFPADRMFFAVVYHQRLGLHVVLMARLDDGDYALDSRSPYVQPWKALPYSVVSIQDASDPTRWFTHGHPRLVLNAERDRDRS